MRYLVLAMATGGISFAAGVYTDPCGDNHVFAGDSSATIFCVIPGGESNSAGTAVAGLNFFETHLSPVRDVGLLDNNMVIFTHTVTSAPTWDKNVTKVPTHLGLDGEIKLFTNDASVNLFMTGLLGGAQLVINKTFVAAGVCPCSGFVNEDVYGFQAPNNLSIQTLVVTINGRARYDAEGSPVFDGTIPEPGTWVLGSVGIFGLGLLRFRNMRLR